MLFEELMRRMPDMELAKEPERLRSNFIGGIKRMPVRVRARAEARRGGVSSGA